MPKIKNFTYAIYNDDINAPVSLTPTQTIARITKVVSSNTWECQLPDRSTMLVQLNSKLHNNVWVRRSGFVLVELFGPEDSESKVRGQIVNVVLYEKKWRKQSYWPKEFPAKNYYSDSEEEESNVGKMPPSSFEDDY